MISGETKPLPRVRTRALGTRSTLPVSMGTEVSANVGVQFSRRVVLWSIRQNGRCRVDPGEIHATAEKIFEFKSASVTFGLEARN